jgi:hypothetical protein
MVAVEGGGRQVTGGRSRLDWRFPILAGCAALLACEGTLPPLRGQITVGRESYAIFVGGSAPAGGDLFAVRADGGSVVPITYSNVGESRPALSPDGGAVAFLRGASLRDSMPGSVWVMNLLSGSERELPLPKGVGAPRRVAWSRDGGSLVVEAAGGLYLIMAPPASPAPRAVQPAERAAAESSLAVLLGDPVFGEVVPCADPGDLCVQADTGSPGLLARDAHDPLRWGPDSVAFFMGDEVEIRPLGPGRARRLSWSNLPRRPRQMTAFVPAPAP